MDLEVCAAVFGLLIVTAILVWATSQDGEE
jgi:hypothetical protein